MCLSCIYLLAMHTLICITFSLPPWLWLLLVALPGLFCFRLPFCLHNTDILRMCIKRRYAKKKFYGKMAAYRSYPFCMTCAQIVHMQGNQLVPQLLLKQSDTLPTQYAHTENLHEEVKCQKPDF